LDCNDEYSLRN